MDVEKREYKIEGMYCPACVKHVEKAALKVEGVSRAEVSLLTSSLIVYYEGSLSDEAIAKSCKKAGYNASSLALASFQKRRALRKQELQKLLNKIIISAVLLLIIMYFSMGQMWGWPSFSPSYINLLIEMSLSFVVILLHASFFYRGFYALFHLAPNMESLVSLGSTATFAFGVYSLTIVIIATLNGNNALAMNEEKNIYFASSAMVPLFVSIGNYLESLAKDKATFALENLSSLVPETAFKKEGDKLVEVSASSLKKDDICFLKEGSKVPSDGKIIEGSGSFLESALTGEALPSFHKEGANVLGGSILAKGTCTIVISVPVSNSLLSKITLLVQNSSASKSPLSKYADKLSRYFTPFVLIVAIITFLAWYFSSHDLSLALNMTVCVLVVSCPCALALASPLATTIATSKALSKGLLIKNAEALNTLASVDTLIFDKTGTLTETYMKVTKLFFLPAYQKKGEQALLALEKHSSHPLAEATCLYLEKEGVTEATLDTYQDIPGIGIEGSVQGEHYLVAKESYFLDKGYKIPPSFSNDEGGSYSLVAYEDKIIGSIALKAQEKEGANEAISELQNMGYTLYLESGDNEASVKSLATSLGLKHYQSECSPLEKEALITSLKKEGHQVAMIGDGINDAPALVKADIGIAIAKGSDLAISSADFLLLNDDLKNVTYLLSLAKRTKKIIIENLIYSCAYNFLAIPLAAGALHYACSFDFNPMLAGALMALSSLSVVLNALRLEKEKHK